MAYFYTTSGITLWFYKTSGIAVFLLETLYHLVFRGIELMPEKKDEKEKVKREPTSIKIDPELWKEAKIEAIRHDIELSELVERSLRREISRIRGGANPRDV